MGPRLLVDTNVVIYYLGDALPDPAAITLDVALEADANLSVITRIELLGYSDETETARTEAFVRRAVVHPLTEDVILQAIEVRKTTESNCPMPSLPLRRWYMASCSFRATTPILAKSPG